MRIQSGRSVKGSPRALFFRSRRRRMVICGWARNSAWSASMALGPSRGRRQPVSNSLVTGYRAFWLRATALFGLARRRALPVGTASDSRDIRELPGKWLLHCCKMAKERFGLASETPAGFVPSEAHRRSAMELGASAGPYLLYTRTTKAICGSRLKRVFGDGRLVLQCATRFLAAPWRPGH